MSVCRPPFIARLLDGQLDCAPANQFIDMVDIYKPAQHYVSLRFFSPKARHGAAAYTKNQTAMHIKTEAADRLVNELYDYGRNCTKVEPKSV